MYEYQAQHNFSRTYKFSVYQMINGGFAFPIGSEEDNLI